MNDLALTEKMDKGKSSADHDSLICCMYLTEIVEHDRM